MNVIKYNKDEFLIRNSLVYGISILNVFIFLKLYLSDTINKYITENITKSNIIPYAVLIFVFMFSVIIINTIVNRTNIAVRLNKLDRISSIIVSFVIIVINAIVLGYVYMTEGTTFDAPVGRMQYHNSDKISICFVIGISFAIIYFIENNKKSNYTENNNRIFFYLFVLAISAIYAFTLYTPNCFSSYANVHHSDAYFNSVYNTMMGVPRSYINAGIYGYYAIFLAPLVKVAGGTLESFYIVVGIIGAISFAMMAYSLDVVIKNSLIKIMGTFALVIPAMTLHWGIYPQLYPHRTIFPAIIIAYMVTIYKKDRIGWGSRALGYVIVTLSVVWNFETGVACVFAWLAFEAYEAVVDNSFKEFRLYRTIVIKILLSVLSFLGALVFVNIITLLMGGTFINLNDFLFPFLNSYYMEDCLIIPLPKTITAWVLIVSLFFVMIAHGILKSSLSAARSEKKKKDKLYFSFGVLGLVHIIYYINRAAYGNLTIIHFVMILILCIVADWSLNNYRDLGRSMCANAILRSLSYVTICTLFFICVGGVCNYYPTEGYKNMNAYRDNTQVEAFVEVIRDSIPENTRAIGNGVSALYSYLGWDTYYYVIDFSDIVILPEAEKYLNDELSELNEPVLINSRSLTTLDSYSENSNEEFHKRFKAEKTFVLYDSEFIYYVPVEDIQ